MTCADRYQTIQINQKHFFPKIPLKTKFQWVNYLTSPTEESGSDYMIDSTAMSKFALAEQMLELEKIEQRTLFHLSVTYKSYGDRTYGEDDVNKFFREFYVHRFLKCLFGKNFHEHRSVQPITYAFVDEHKIKRRLSDDTLPLKLHHHAILAVHPETVEMIDRLVGTDTLVGNRFTHKVRTTYLRQCDAQTLLYAAKKLNKYPAFQSFPDKQ